MEQILIGIDDTDNKDSRGTGYHSRCLAGEIIRQGIGVVRMISRHQLFVHPAIKYTSQNSAACLLLKSAASFDEIILFCENYLEKISAAGSDVGFCLSNYNQIPASVVHWGYRAKEEVLQLREAESLADRNEIYLSGLTGDFGGKIGALAAVGLRQGGNDGRIIWLTGTEELRDVKDRVMTADQMKENLGIEVIINKDGGIVRGENRVFTGDWLRPVIKENKVVLPVEKKNNPNYEFQTASKEFIRSIS